MTYKCKYKMRFEGEFDTESQQVKCLADNTFEAVTFKKCITGA